MGGVGRITIVAVLLDASNEVAGGCVLEEEVHRHGEWFFSVEEARLLRGERLGGVTHWGWAQGACADWTVGAKGGGYSGVSRRETVLQPGGDTGPTRAW